MIIFPQSALNAELKERTLEMSLLKNLSCTVLKNPIYVFPEMKLHGLVPNSRIHVFVSDFNPNPD